MKGFDMRTPQQLAALTAPLVGRDGDRVQAWQDTPWAFALSFNR